MLPLKNKFFFLFAAALILFIVSSCDVQKRRYRDGYYTSTPAKPETTSINDPQQLNTQQQKHLSSPFLTDSSSLQTNHSSNCDTIYFNDGKKLTVSFKEKTSDEIKYYECGTHDIAYAVYKKDVYLIKRADGTSVNLKDEKIADSDTTKSECDKIYFKNGDEKLAIVTEITEEEVKYRECHDKYGIVFGIYKKDVIMVKRSNGSYDVISESLGSKEEDAPKKPKGTHSKGVAFVLCLLAGGWGLHRFYLGHTVSGIIYLLTFGFCGIGVIIDLIRIAAGDLKPRKGSYKKGGGIPL